MAARASLNMHVPGKRLLKEGDPQLNILLFAAGTKKLDARRAMTSGEWIRQRRLEKGLTQKQAAADLAIPVRQLRSYEAMARWPQEAREFVKTNSAKIGVGLLVRGVANRRWGSKQALLAALQRLVDGRPPRKRSRKGGESGKVDPDILAIEERLRDRLQMRTALVSDGQSGKVTITLSSVADHERLLELLGA